MKNIYTTLLTGAALMLASGVSAQKGTHAQGHYNTLRPAHGVLDARGGGVPANDECTGATAHALAIDGNVVINGDNTGGTDSEGIGFATTWEAITLTSCANVTVNYCGTAPAFGNFALGIGDCPISMVITPSGNTDCGDGNLVLTYEAVPAGTWYIPVLVEAGSEGPYTMTVSAAACPAGPANDECDGAMVLTSGTTCVTTPFNTIGATETLPAILCGGFTSGNALDVWFSFVATATTQTIGVLGWAGADAMVELFSGTCAAPVSMACADATYPPTGVEDSAEQLVQG